MKKIFIYAAVAALAMSAASCQKEDLNENGLSKDGLVFNAAIDGGMVTKTTLTSEKKVNWETGDEISINSIRYVAAPNTDATTAKFTKKYSHTEAPEGPFNAFYPAGIQTGTTAAGELPATQTYAAGKITNVPMFATSTTTNLYFKNICAVLAVTVMNADFPSVKSIRVSSSNKALSGAFTVSDGTTAVLESAAQKAMKPVTLSCGTAVTTASEGTVFYIAVPAQTYRNLKIELSADGSSYTETMTTNKDVDIAVAVNTLYPITFKADEDVLLPGKFSVASGKQVQFTKGNLYWDGSAFKLEENQTAYPTSWSTSHVGHFYWTKTAAASYAENYDDGTCTGSDKFFADGSDDDHKLTVCRQSGLYVLSEDEWTYLLAKGTHPPQDRIDLCKYPVEVNGVANCLVIAPDGYEETIEESYTAAEWAIAELVDGLVCLPAAGIRNNSKDPTLLEDGGSSGHYWSATPSYFGEGSACGLIFAYNFVKPAGNGYDRSKGLAVRLVSTVSY